MQFQKKDYSYIETAGQNIKQGIEDVSQALDRQTLAKAKKIDENTFDTQIYPAQIDEAVKLAIDAGMDDTQAHIMAVRYFYNRLLTETPLQAIERFNANDAKFRVAINTEKEKLFQKKSQEPVQTAPGKEAVPEQLGAIVPQGIGGQNAPYTQQKQMMPQSSPEASRDARLAGSVNSTMTTSMGELPGDRPEPGRDVPIPGQPAVPAQTRPQNAQELQRTAIGMGMGESPVAKTAISQAANRAIGQQQYPEGTTQEQVYGNQLASGNVTPEGETLAKMYPTQAQLEANKIKIKNQESLDVYRKRTAGARERLDALRGNKLAEDQELKIMNGKADAMADSNKLILKEKTELTKLERDYKESSKNGGRPFKNWDGAISYTPDEGYIDGLLDAIEKKHASIDELESEKEINTQIYEGIRTKKTNKSKPTLGPQPVAPPVKKRVWDETTQSFR